MKKLLILRGLPGSGKSRHAKLCGGLVCSADHLFERDGAYHFDVTKLAEAHMLCQFKALDAMASGVEFVIIDNTNVRHWEYLLYQRMADHFGYETEVKEVGGHSMEDVRRYAERNIHGVPELKILEMAYRWEE
jgi:predicted kinase